MTCAQPGCGGSIVDGYCDICGMPPDSPATTNQSATEHQAPPQSTPKPAPAALAAATAQPTPPQTQQKAHPAPRPQPKPVPVLPDPRGTLWTPSGTPRGGSGQAGGSSSPPSSKGQAARSGTAPAPPAGAGSRGRPGSRPMPPAGPCKQPGCTGRIRDGYCDVCGSPASAVVVPVGSTAVTKGSTALSSALIGTQRLTGGQTQASRRTTSARLRAQRLGAGLTTVPPSVTVDPSSAVLADPVVPEHRRNCPHCGQPVGRAIGDQEGRVEGFCPNCRKPYSFTAKLVAGDLIANQYEIVGPLAHGGMGWIYLAKDKNVSDRWVVLKGLLNAGDADALAATISEQRFLAQVNNPLIVEIHNFVEHEGAGYIVMEYVGGRSLKELLAERKAANGGVHDPLPVDQALAFIAELLPAFSYLHDSNLLYCDLKPDNVIQVGDSLKLIDLGGVRRIDDDHSPIFGTVGFQAPEVATVGPSIASDIYTIGRTLLVLVADVPRYQSSFATMLPPVADVPAFAQFDSVYRLVQKCCAPAPADRFQSADELLVQVLGVLREVVGTQRGTVATTSASSLLFEPPMLAGDTFDWRYLPRLRRDTTDPNYGWLSSFGPDADPADVLSTLQHPPSVSPEVLLLQGDAALRVGNHEAVKECVRALLADDPWEWRAVWLAGLDALVTGDLPTAQSSFNAVYGQVPGELAPKLALAIACERGHETILAEALYEICASTDANYVTAAGFGLARIRAKRRDLPGTLAALDLVPPTNRGYVESRRLKARHLLALGSGLDHLAQAWRFVQVSRLDPPGQAEYEVQILERALQSVASDPPPPGSMLGEVPATPEDLRHELEQAYRRLALFAADPGEGTLLVDLANRTRKWSLL